MSEFATKEEWWQERARLLEDENGRALKRIGELDDFVADLAKENARLRSLLAEVRGCLVESTARNSYLELLVPRELWERLG